MPVLWIAARHTLVAAAFSLAAFYAHARARTDGSTRALAPAVFAVALLAGEMALGTLALLVAWERLDRRTAPRRLVRLLAPFFALAALYLAVYVGLGYGTRESGAYAATAPTIATLTLALRHWLILLSELASATPSDLLGGSSDAVQWLAAVWGTAVVAIVWLIARVVRPWLDPREPRTLLWMAVAAVAAAAPGALAPVGGRVLTLALVPASGVIGTLLAGGWHALRRSRVTPSRRWLVAAILAGLAFGHLVFSPVVRIGAGVEMTRLGREQYRIAAAVPACGSTIVLIAAADPTLSTYVPAILRLTDRPIQDVRTLSAAAVDHRIERVSATGFDLVTRRNGVEATLWERLYRADSMRPGQVVSVDSFDAKVLEVENGWPTRVRFEFRTPLDTLCFLEWRNGRLEHRRLATDTAVTVSYERGPLGW
jgi:hypothetical protein